MRSLHVKPKQSAVRLIALKSKLYLLDNQQPFVLKAMSSQRQLWLSLYPQQD